MNKKEFYLAIFICIAIFSCQTKTEKSTRSEPLRHVGDILEDSELDTTNFQPCHEDLTFQYYNFGNGIQYQGEKAAIVEIFNNEFIANPANQDNGYVTIRFIVNCKGESGRFRVIELDNNYNKTTLSLDIVNQIADIVRRLDGWKIGEFDNGKVYDYYQYLTFKISNGQITDIMP